MSTLFFKVVVLGEGRVGKTSMSLKFVDGKFDENQESTINASYLEKNVTLKNGKTVRLAIWDTAGQEKYNAIAPVYYRDAFGAIIVYEITSSQSFDKVKKWTAELKQYADKDIIISVAGNKSDMETMRKVKKSDAERYAADNGLKHYGVSAKSGQNIDAIFNEMCEEIYQQKFANEEVSVPLKGRKRPVVKINIEDEKRRNQEDRKSGGCCGGSS